MNRAIFDSETVKRVAMGDLPGELDRTRRTLELDLASLPQERQIHQTLDELPVLSDEQAAIVARTLDDITAADLLLDWTVREGDNPFFSMPRGMAIRVFCMSHMVHHRAQLGVYLRMLGAPVPQTYGPTADAPEMG